VTPKALNQAVKRNMERFPADFMLQLTWEESQSLRSQFVTLQGEGTRGRTGRHAKYRPYGYCIAPGLRAKDLRRPQCLTAMAGRLHWFFPM
jgi:hypothetical protein